MSVFITGITGFIGSELGRRIIEEGFEVYGFVRHTSKRDLKPIEDYLEKIRIIQGDLRDYSSIRRAIRDAMPQFILHLGAMTPVRISFEDPFSNLETNLLGTCSLVHAVLEVAPRLERFILGSTMEVYGWQQKKEPFGEELPLNPASPYAVSKAAADMYVRMAGDVFNLNYTVLRPANTYGRKHETGFIVEYLITSMMRGGPVYVGTPDSVRDLLYIEDHVNAYLESLKSDHAHKQVFNVCSGAGISMRELADNVAKKMGYDGPIMHSYPPGYPRRPAHADAPYLVMDNSKIRQVVGWSPKYSLDEGLDKTIQYWCS